MGGAQTRVRMTLGPRGFILPRTGWEACFLVRRGRLARAAGVLLPASGRRDRPEGRGAVPGGLRGHPQTAEGVAPPEVGQGEHRSPLADHTCPG